MITNVTSLSVGVYWLEVRAYDPYTQYCSASFKITVEDTIDPTWVFVPTNQDVEFGDGLNYDLDASDLSGIADWWLNDTTYFIIDDVTGVITNVGQVPVGEYWLEVRAYDPYTQYCSASFKITVEDTIDPTWVFVPTNQDVEFGDGLNYDLDASDLSGIADWWLNDTTYFIIDDVTGVITNVGQVPVGEYWLEVRAYDPYNHNCSAIFKISVQDTTAPTWVQEPADQYVEFGDGLIYDLNATDASGINNWWLNDTTYFTIDNQGVISNITLLNDGIYWIEVRAYDPYGHFCSDILKITVAKPIIPQDITWIIIIVIGSSAGVAAVSVITVLLVRKRRRKKW